MNQLKYVHLLSLGSVLSLVINGSPIENVAGASTEPDANQTSQGQQLSEAQANRKLMEKKSSFWYDNAIERLEKQLNIRPNFNVAKNVVVFLGDGMSMTTVTAARIYGGQLKGATGEEYQLEFEKLPYSGLSKTYCVDKQVADSACSATALMCGVKNQLGTLGVTGSVLRGNCNQVNSSTSVPSIMHWAQLAGKSTGIVTTTRVTHASPAATYAHSADRKWESETKHKSCKSKDIAYQLVTSEPGKNFNVIMGGGKSNFYPKNAVDEEGKRGKRKDGKDLIEIWHQTHTGMNAQYIHNRDQLLALDFNSTDYLLGLFTGSHFDYHLDANATQQPTLEEMTSAAIKILSKNPNGYFLFVEGGRIDHGHHETKALKALDETVEFSNAVGETLKLVNTESTLIIVTADHAHTLTMSGYPARGSPITGQAGTALDSTPYSTLSYANGPQSSHFHDDERDERFPSMVALKKETHGGEDVPVYSIGPWSHLLTGNYEQNYIPLAILYSACVGPLPTACHPPQLERTNTLNLQLQSHLDL